jgi:hypothetical protein
MHALRTATVAAILLLAGANVCNAQQNFLGTEEIIANGTSYYTFARAGEATIRVMVVGAGGGIYEIGANTTMDEFLALLGGAPQFATETPGTRTRIRVQLFRLEDGRRGLLYDKELEQMIVEPSDYPTLEDGDVFVVRTRTRNKFQWRDALTVLTSTSTVLLLLERLGVITLRRNR